MSNVMPFATILVLCTVVSKVDTAILSHLPVSSYLRTPINIHVNHGLQLINRKQNIKMNCEEKSKLSGSLFCNSNQISASESGRQLEFCMGKSKVAIVTGAGRGIGRCIAKTLAIGGVSHVICISRSEETCSKTADDINKLWRESNDNSKAYASSYAVDVSNKEEVRQLFEKLNHIYKTIDILVNNAGITKDSLFIRMEEKEWEDVINTNLNSAFYFTSHVIRKMVKNKYGRIVNISSVSGIGGNAGQANYAASKAALIGFSKSLANEFASRNITINCIAPGYIESDMTNALPDNIKKTVLEHIPAGRFGKPQEVADLVAFLCTENAAYINGKVFAIDGALLFGSN